MDWFVNYVLPVLITVISGVLVYMSGELLNTIWLRPLQEYKIIKSSIAKNLVFYANVYTNTSDGMIENEEWKKLRSDASDKLRWLAAELDGFIQTLSFIKIGIPKKVALKKGSGLLIFLSNSMYDPNRFNQGKENRDVANEIRGLLKILLKVLIMK